jgi:hypothetical protein
MTQLTPRLASTHDRWFEAPAGEHALAACRLRLRHFAKRRPVVVDGFSGPPERDGTCDRSRAGADGMAVIAALHDPMTVFVTDYLADMVTPNHDGTDGRAARVVPVMSPGSRQIVGGAGIGADLPAHVPSAPGPGLAATAVMAVSGGIVMMVPGSIMVVMVPGSIMVVVVMMLGSLVVMVMRGVP